MFPCLFNSQAFNSFFFVWIFLLFLDKADAVLFAYHGIQFNKTLILQHFRDSNFEYLLVKLMQRHTRNWSHAIGTLSCQLAELRFEIAAPVFIKVNVHFVHFINFVHFQCDYYRFLICCHSHRLFKIKSHFRSQTTCSKWNLKVFFKSDEKKT